MADLDETNEIRNINWVNQKHDHEKTLIEESKCILNYTIV